MKKLFSGIWAICCLAGIFIAAFFSAKALMDLRGSLENAVEKGREGGCE